MEHKLSCQTTQTAGGSWNRIAKQGTGIARRQYHLCMQNGAQCMAMFCLVEVDNQQLHPKLSLPSGFSLATRVCQPRLPGCQAVRERMNAARKLAEAVRGVLPGFRGSATPELGVSRSGRGRKARKVRDATPTPEPVHVEPLEATIDNLRELASHAMALHIAFPELEALQDAIACFDSVQVLCQLPSVTSRTGQ